MKGLKIAGIVVAIVAVIVLIIWAIRKSMIGKDVKTGVANDKIEEAAIASGIHPEVARVVANAPSTSDALKSIGSPGDVADAIASGNTVPVNVMVSTGLVAVMDLRPITQVEYKKGDQAKVAGKCYEVLAVEVVPGNPPTTNVTWSGEVPCKSTTL